MSHERVNTQPTFLLLTLLFNNSHLTQTRTVVAPLYIVEILTALRKSITGIVNFVGALGFVREERYDPVFAVLVAIKSFRAGINEDY